MSVPPFERGLRRTVLAAGAATTGAVLLDACLVSTPPPRVEPTPPPTAAPRPTAPSRPTLVPAQTEIVSRQDLSPQPYRSPNLPYTIHYLRGWYVAPLEGAQARGDIYIADRRDGFVRILQIQPTGLPLNAYVEQEAREYQPPLQIDQTTIGGQDTRVLTRTELTTPENLTQKRYYFIRRGRLWQITFEAYHSVAAERERQVLTMLSTLRFTD